MNTNAENEPNDPIAGETKDAKNVPFDPARHLPRLNPRTKSWIPKSPGRPKKGEKTGTAISDSTPTQSESSATITVETPLPPVLDTQETPVNTPLPETPLPGEMPNFDDIEAAAKKATSPETDVFGNEQNAENAPTANKGGSDAKSSPDDLARVVQKGLYLATGKAIGNMKAAVPPADLDKSLREMLSAFFRWRGIHLIGWLALGVGAISYFLREDIIDAINAKRKGKPEPRPVTPVAPPQPVEKTTIPVSQTNGPFDRPPVTFDAFGGHF